RERNSSLLARALGSFDFDLVIGNEATVAANDFHLALLRHRREPAREPRHNLVLPIEQLRGIDLELTELDAGGLHLLRVLDDLRRVQQSFRRDAADVETDAAELRP